MQITIFGVSLLIFLTIYIIKNIKNPKLGNDIYFFSIVSLLILDIGYVAKIGSFVVEYNYVFSSLNFVFALIALFTRKHKPKRLKILFAFILFLFFSLLFPLIFNLKFNSVPFDGSWDIYFGTNLAMNKVGFSFHAIPMFMRCIIFILSFYTFAISATKEDLKNYAKKIYKISWYVIIVCAAEFIITNFINPFTFRKLCFNIFGHSDSTYILPRMTGGGIYLPMVFMREPSSFVRTIFIMCVSNIMIYISGLKNKKMSLNVIILIFLLIISKSLSAYIYLGSIILIFWYLIKERKTKKMLVIFAIISAGILLFAMGNRIISIFGVFKDLNKNPNELQQTSELIRLYSINNNFQYFLRFFLTGCGFGTICCYSSIITMLANIGIIGVIFYVNVIYRLNSIAVKYSKFSWFTFTIVVITHLLIGHMSYLMYLETAAYLYICLKNIDCLRSEGELK